MMTSFDDSSIGCSAVPLAGCTSVLIRTLRNSFILNASIRNKQENKSKFMYNVTGIMLSTVEKDFINKSKNTYENKKSLE